MTFQLGEYYTRADIHNELGGGIQDFLPHVDGRVVCGCFTSDLNPNAPWEILPGNGPDIIHWAEVFRQQGNAIPVFLKREVNRWEYTGMWRAGEIIKNQQEIAEREQRTGRTDISMIVTLIKDVD
ncbi:MAG: hypothetical protein HY313_09230 [Acidobacteria bacterium]|nr:hypothetical protein [Acidobacteriota bacterium]